MLIRGETIKYCKEARKRQEVEDKLGSKVEASQNTLNKETSDTNMQLQHKSREELKMRRKPYIGGGCNIETAVA